MSKKKKIIVRVSGFVLIFSLIFTNVFALGNFSAGNYSIKIVKAEELTLDPVAEAGGDVSSSEVLPPDNQTATSTVPSLAGEAPAGDSAASLDQATSTEASAQNTDTGADSTNTSTTDISNTTDVLNENFAQVYNDSYLRSETGRNDASYNTGSGIISTQFARGQGELLNIINKNKVTTPDAQAPSEVTAGNENTGVGSDNLATANINNQLTVKNVNDSNTINRLAADVNSGNNKTDYNTGHGITLTGDASLGLNFLTMANTNVVGSQKFYGSWQNIYENWTGNIDLSAQAAADFSPLSDLLIEASNKSTGADSTNQAIVNVNDETTIINENVGKISNEIDAKVVSGRNQSNHNTGSGSVTTGDVNSSVNVINFLNSNVNSSNWWLKTLNVFGDWQGNLMLPQMPAPNLSEFDGSQSQTSQNTETGADSQNSADINVDNSLAIQNSNTATIKNDVTLKSITGENKTSYNSGSGVIKFGGSDAETNEVNVANLNVTGDSWWLVVLNNFGSWQGTAIGSPADVGVKATSISTVISPLGAGIEVTNNSTGPDSNNTAGANINHSTDIANTNQADILNVLNVEAVSGENEAQWNTGHGYIDTGDVRAVNNLVNFANANISVGNWMVVVVNVFGDWNGNLVFNTVNGQSVSLSNLGGQAGGSASSQNTDTGADSQNTAGSTTNIENTVTNTNTANSNSTTSATSLTGENQASYNTGSGVVSTGSADTTSGVSNQVNNNNVAIGENSCDPDMVSQNSTTGESSTNNASSTVNCTNNITNDNASSVNNNYSATNITGQNSANYNTGDGLVDTSWATTYLGLYNEVNDNQITLGNLQEDFVPPADDGAGNNNNNNNDGDNNNDNGNGDNGDNNNDNDNGSGDGSSGGNSGGSSGGSSGGGGSSNGASSGGGSAGGSGGGIGGNTLTFTPKKLRGDLNNDGKVDDYDFSILMAGWSKMGKSLAADANLDEQVDDYDFSIVMFEWTTTLASKV